MLDNTNHDLIHTLSVRLDARWHDRDYEDESTCKDCRGLFERLKQLDDEAISLLTAEIAEHVRKGHFMPGALERV